MATWWLIQVRNFRTQAILFFVFSLITAVPFVIALQMLNSTHEEHALHLCYAFQSTIIGCALASGYSLFRKSVLGQKITFDNCFAG
jgi:hypothetical protein